jgi:hypothetical protein
MVVTKAKTRTNRSKGMQNTKNGEKRRERETFDGKEVKGNQENKKTRGIHSS